MFSAFGARAEGLIRRYEKSQAIFIAHEEITLADLDILFRLHCLKLVDIGEGKIMGIVTYNTQAEFEESNKWMIPILNEVAQSLSAKFESLSGQEIISYE